ncbi:hypothetical protein [Pseudomonas machongensis]|uniref:hypothetical protein n=1 Tax=Pseudomonas machongensis TaxID=3110229 RepID=UPI00389A384B
MNSTTAEIRAITAVCTYTLLFVAFKNGGMKAAWSISALGFEIADIMSWRKSTQLLVTRKPDWVR